MGFKLVINDRNTGEEGHRVYKSQTPMDPNNLPAPYDTFGPNITEWEDGYATADETYYYRVSAFTSGGSVEMVSDEIEAVAVEPNAPTIGLVSYFDMELNTNGDLIDQVGGHHATVFGATQTTTLTGKAMYFDGSNDYAKADGSGLSSNNIALSFWFRTTSAATSYLWAQQRTDRNARGVAMSTAGVFGVARNASSNSTSAYEQVGPVLGLQDGNWHHCVYQQIGLDLKLAFDNATFLTTIMPSATPAESWVDELILAARMDGTTTNSHAAVDLAHFRTYSRELTSHDIADLYSEYAGKL